MRRHHNEIASRFVRRCQDAVKWITIFDMDSLAFHASCIRFLGSCGAGTVIYERPPIAKAFLIYGEVGFAVIYPASRCGLGWPRALMESEDRRPVRLSSSRARTVPRVWPVPVTLFRHHIIITFAILKARQAA